ncbi:MAG: carbon storage regulator CsrA [Firmicutes bacterium]|nr:carbon storage regulator CsrA [Bacillota bacterium]
MLVLTRKSGQNLIINDNITVRILEVKGGQVKLGIVAPRNVSVHREEVYLAIKEANLQAALTDKNIPELPLPAGKG